MITSYKMKNRKLMNFNIACIKENEQLTWPAIGYHSPKLQKTMVGLLGI